MDQLIAYLRENGSEHAAEIDHPFPVEVILISKSEIKKKTRARILVYHTGLKL